MNASIVIYTDGACKGNPGPGGWGVLLQYKLNNKIREKELYGGQPNTTNNRMELLATIVALEALKKPSTVLLYTDSKYVSQGITQWIANWKAKGWKTAAKKSVKNQDLWCRLDIATTKHKIDWVWVKGHSGNKGNDRADMLANKGIATL